MPLSCDTTPCPGKFNRSSPFPAANEVKRHQQAVHHVTEELRESERLVYLLSYRISIT